MSHVPRKTENRLDDGAAVGGHIGRIYIESKGRPIYIAKETNLEDKDL